MKTKISGLLVLLVILSGCFSQHKLQKSSKNLTIAFYNVENLFDTIDAPGFSDEEFTPDGFKKWNTKRYEKKLSDLARVFSSIHQNSLTAVIGMAEIENNTVLKDLVAQPLLLPAHYQIVHEESPDFRGIDVALLYNSSKFSYISHKAIPVHLAGEKNFRTRDILYVKGLIGKKDTLHIFVNHWSSRIGGEEKTEYKRVAEAEILRHAVDSIQKIIPAAKIFIMGDFNDEPGNKSILTALDAGPACKNAPACELHNLMYQNYKNGLGTYSYKNNWNLLDNLIASHGLINPARGWQADCNSGQIFKADWMMYKNPKAGEAVPNRTYGGKNYFGGISDHLPVYVVLHKK